MWIRAVSKAIIFMGWDETPHLDKAAREALIASYPLHERDSRTKGEPSLGAGAIYPVPVDDIACAPFDVPAYWARGYGLDVGWNVTAAVFGAHDRENDVVYVYDEHYRQQVEPPIHAAAIRARGEYLRGVIDPASMGSSQADGKKLFPLYGSLGLNLTAAENAVESGILEVWQRLSTGRLRIFSTCANLLKEYRFYRRNEKGLIVKSNDHALDALRYFIVSGLGFCAVPPDYLERMGFGGRPDARVLRDYDVLAEA